MKTKRIVMSLMGVIICAIAVGVFKIAALGVDPFQSLMSGLNQLIPISFGTLITAFFMGPLVEFFNVKIARPLLKTNEPLEKI